MTRVDRRGEGRREAQRWAHRHQLLLDALVGCGIDLSDSDHTAVEWIAGWETETVRTIASWVLRAGAATRNA